MTGKNALVDSRFHTRCTTHNKYFVFIAEQNVLGIDAVVLAVMLPKCMYSHIAAEPPRPAVKRYQDMIFGSAGD